MVFLQGSIRENKVPSFKLTGPALRALDFHPCVISLVGREGSKVDAPSLVVSFVYNAVPFFGPDLQVHSMYYIF